MEKQKVTINAKVENLEKLKELLSEVETLKEKFDIGLSIDYQEVEYFNQVGFNEPDKMPSVESIYQLTKNDISREESQHVKDGHHPLRM